MNYPGFARETGTRRTLDERRAISRRLTTSGNDHVGLSAASLVKTGRSFHECLGWRVRDFSRSRRPKATGDAAQREFPLAG